MELSTLGQDLELPSSFGGKGTTDLKVTDNAGEQAILSSFEGLHTQRGVSSWPRTLLPLYMINCRGNGCCKPRVAGLERHGFNNR